MTAKVFISSEPYRDQDFSSAAGYGTIHFIFDQDLYAPSYPDDALIEAIAAVREFNPATDYLCYSGTDPMALVSITAALVQRGVQEIKVLKWQKERVNGERTGRGFYIPGRMPLDITKARREVSDE